MNTEQWNKQWSQIVAKAWSDAAFKRRLLVEPEVVLQEHGIAVPPGTSVKVVENTDDVLHLTLPIRRSSGELTEHVLQEVCAGLVTAEDPVEIAASSGTGSGTGRYIGETEK